MFGLACVAGMIVVKRCFDNWRYDRAARRHYQIQTFGKGL